MAITALPVPTKTIAQAAAEVVAAIDMQTGSTIWRTGHLPLDPVERAVNFTAAPNFSYAVDVRTGMKVITPAAGFVVGDAIQIVDSRFVASASSPIRFSVAFTAYLFGGKNQDLDLVIPGVSAIMRYRGAVIGFVRES